MTALTSRVVAPMNCPKEVVLWNYWDHEHVIGTHYKSYSKMRVLAERDGWCLSVRHFKLPYIPIHLSSLNFQFMDGKDRFKSIHIGKLGQRLEQTFTFEAVDEENCVVTLDSRIEVPFFLGLLQKFFVHFTTKWFYATWDEDHPMRLRRWKVWKLGFRDFSGLEYINKKIEKPAHLPQARPYPHVLPVPKSTPITVKASERPFAQSIEVGYGLQDL